MKAERIEQFLEQISPEAFSYLFPGRENPCQIPLPCFPSITFDAAPPLKIAREKTCERPREKVLRKPCEKSPESASKKLDVSPRTQLILREIERLQQNLGITLEEIEQALSYQVTLSRLRISRQHRLFLDDFNGVEVKMNALDKTVYLFYLQHPEGVSFKQLADYKLELLNIYTSVSGREDMEAMRSSIDTLTDPFDNSINEKVSKIKKAFLNVVSDRIAQHYYIRGEAGTAKSITLDRSLVVIE